MDKKIFPGGTTAKMREEMRKEARRKKETSKRLKQETRAFHKAVNAEKKQREKEARQKFLKDIGPATRLLIARRGFAAFMVAVAVEIGLGSLLWMWGNVDGSDAAKPKEYRREYLVSLKNAYNVTNLFDGDKWKRKEHDRASDATETLFAILLLIAALEIGRRHVKDDEIVAKRTLKVNISTGVMDDLYNIKTGHVWSPGLLWNMHPVSRAVIKHLSSQDSMRFNALLKGKVHRASRDYTMAVIRGYLETHPDELQKVLDVYEEESLPKSLLRKYGGRTR